MKIEHVKLVIMQMLLSFMFYVMLHVVTNNYLEYAVVHVWTLILIPSSEQD